MAKYKTTKTGGTTTVYQESSTYPGSFDTVVSALPGGATAARFGGRKALPYNREAKAVFNNNQFGTGKYFDPNYLFSADWNLNQENRATLESRGVNRFSRFVLPDQNEYNALPSSKRFYYQTENELHGPMEGAGYYESSLATLEDRYNAVIPSGNYYWVANIETSNEWTQWRYGENKFGYDSWSVAQNRSIVCEIDGQTRTLGQLFNTGLWEAEANTRRNNRLALMMTIARRRNTYCAYGSSMFQGEPRTNSLSTTNLFKEGTANVSAIGGDGQGNIVLNGRSYTGINKNVFAYENSTLDYYYYMGWADFPVSDYNDIWVNRLNGTQTMPYIWSKQVPYHITASEKGHWQANKYRMLTINGQIDRGSVRMQEPFFEDKFYLADGRSFPAFVPFTELQNINIDGYLLTPKLYLPPYYFYSTYMTHRFLEGSTPGSGYHLFNAPGITKVPSSHPIYNHHLHSITALFQARNDMQPYEKFLAESTLVVDPEVQINSSGGWSAYSGAEAFAFGPDGGRGTQKPAYSLRYKAVTGGWIVLIIGGMNQGWTTERTDKVRVPGGGLNGNTFSIKLRGPATQAFEFFVVSGDSNQTYTASFASTSFEQPGYAGRIQS